MNYLKDAIQSILGGQKNIENEWQGIGQSAPTLGLSLTGVASNFKELSHQNYPESKNAYLKLCRKAHEFTEQIRSYFKDHKEFANEIKAIAKESGHTVEKMEGIGFRIKNSSGPFIDVDFAGNIEFKTKNISSPALERYIDAVTNKFKDNEAYIVFKGGENYSEADNQELLRTITKSMIANDIDFKRLHLVDSKYQSIVDEMSPVPTRMELIEGQYIKSDKPLLFDPQDPDAVLAHRGLNLIKYSGGNLSAFEKYEAIYKQEHKIEVAFHESADLISFKNTESNNIVYFRTASIREGGARLRDMKNNPDSQKSGYLDTGFQKQYNEQGQNVVNKKSKGLSYA